MRKYFQVLLFVLSQASLWAQGSGQLDSLHLTLTRAANDSVKMDVYSSIGIYYGESNRDSALWYREKALALARKLHLKINEADILTGEGYMYLLLGDYPKSLMILLQALEILKGTNKVRDPYPISWGQSDGTTRLGTLSVVYGNFGLLYGLTGDRKKEIENYRESVRIAETINDSETVAIGYGLLGKTFSDAGNYDSSLFFANKSLPFFSAGSKYKGMSYVLIGYSYNMTGRFELAKSPLKMAIQIGGEKNNLATLADAYLELTRLYKLTNRNDSALFYASKALDAHRELKQAARLAEVYVLLSGIYVNKGEEGRAFYYLKQATVIKDSLQITEQKRLKAFQNIGFNEQLRARELEKEKAKSRERVKMYSLLAGLGVLLVIGLLLYRNNRHKQKANIILQQQNEKIASTLAELKATQSQLIQSEKMASLGELTAGIAHEIQNPLNFVNNFSEVNTELIEEAKEEIYKGNIDELKSILNDIKDNEQKINHHGKRADAIVKGMLQHSRSSSGVKEPTDINALTDEYIRLCYHGL
ncbi:MAG: hypothetical protein ABIT05_13875, partial [Chitinophagaceae bacterium]